jgi:putative aldouronate transport system permease protein
MSIGETRRDIVFDSVTRACVSAACLVVLYPLYFIVIASLSDPQYVLNGEVFLWPRGLNLAGYERILRYRPLLVGYRNSLFYAVVGSLLSSTLTLFGAYTLSRAAFSGRRAFTFFLLVTMFFSGGLIPQYIVVNALGLRNTYGALLVVHGIQVVNLFIASSFFRSTDIAELYEACQLDGYAHFGYFFKILLPISTPIAIVMILFYGVWQWNDFFRALIYLDRPELYPIQLVLRDLLASSQITGAMVELLSEDQGAYAEMIKAAESMKYGIIIVASLPMLALYLLLQRYFVKGITMGSVKG